MSVYQYDKAPLIRLADVINCFDDRILELYTYINHNQISVLFHDHKIIFATNHVYLINPSTKAQRALTYKDASSFKECLKRHLSQLRISTL